MSLRIGLATILFLFALQLHAQGARPPFANDVKRVTAIEPTAEGCVVTAMSCNSTARGKLAVGDCTQTTDGTFFDVFEFSGAAGQVVRVDVRPISQTLTNPTVAIVPPAGDASKTPIVFGAGGGVSAFYVLSSSGKWRVGIGTRDLFATGDYFVSIQCFTDTDPTAPQNCVYQELLCGQGAWWYLTSQSCRFSGTGANPDYS